MKVEAPRDLQGRLLRCQNRAQMIHEALEAFAHSDMRRPSSEALDALGDCAEELADEIAAIEAAYVGEDTARL
jgi:hypothetical protein